MCLKITPLNMWAYMKIITCKNYEKRPMLTFGKGEPNRLKVTKSFPITRETIVLINIEKNCNPESGYGGLKY